MPLTDEDEATATRVANELRTGNTRAYIALRNVLVKQFPSKPEEGDSIMAIIFNLLPQEARDGIAIVLTDAAARAAANKNDLCRASPMPGVAHSPGWIKAPSTSDACGHQRLLPSAISMEA
jgi:hypothetical protein